MLSTPSPIKTPKIAVTARVTIFIIGLTASFTEENEESSPAIKSFKLSRGVNADVIVVPIVPNCPENESALSPMAFKP